MPFYVYILLCVDGSLYTGYTKNVKKRIRQHTSGKGARYTRIHEPRELAYVETFESRGQAMKREKQIKRLNHKQKTNLINSKKSAN